MGKRFRALINSNFLQGMGYILDISPSGEYTLIEYSDHSAGLLTDRDALESDWAQIGDDLRQAIQEVQHGDRTIRK